MVCVYNIYCIFIWIYWIYTHNAYIYKHFMWYIFITYASLSSIAIVKNKISFFQSQPSTADGQVICPNQSDRMTTILSPQFNSIWMNHPNLFARWLVHQLYHPYLGGGNSNIFLEFSPLCWERFPFLTNIFQRGCNHQLVILFWNLYITQVLCLTLGPSQSDPPGVLDCQVMRVTRVVFAIWQQVARPKRERWWKMVKAWKGSTILKSFKIIWSPL